MSVTIYFNGNEYKEYRAMIRELQAYYEKHNGKEYSMSMLIRSIIRDMYVQLLEIKNGGNKK